MDGWTDVTENKRPLSKFIHSFIFSHYFILVRVVVDLELIPVTPGTMNGMLVHYRAPCMDTRSHLGAIQSTCWHVFDSGMKPENPEETHK